MSISYINKIQNLHNIECIHDLQIKEKSQSSQANDEKIALEVQKEQDKHLITENNTNVVQDLLQKNKEIINDFLEMVITEESFRNFNNLKTEKQNKLKQDEIGKKIDWEITSKYITLI